MHDSILISFIFILENYDYLVGLTHLYEVHPTIIFLGSLVSDFVGNLCAQKLNKAHTMRAKISGAQHNLRGSTGSGVNIVLYFLFTFYLC